MIFTKSAFADEAAKSIDVKVVLQPKSMKNHHNFGRANNIAIFFQFSWNFINFYSILGSKMHPKEGGPARETMVK